MPGVFISYRRDDSGGYAGRLFDVLVSRFGPGRTFMDLDAIKGGDDFAEVIDQRIHQCSVLLAVIGERWLTLTGEGGRRRIDMPGDFVRLEIAEALERGVRVIPVLTGGATVPRSEDLPDVLRPLALHQAMDLRDAHFHADADLLVDLLRKTVPDLGVRPWRPMGRRWMFLAAAVLVAAAIAGAVVRDRQPASDRSSPATAPIVSAAKIAGRWHGTVRYDWGANHTERFDFAVLGHELTGTASFLEVGRGIFDGNVEGNRVTFTTTSAAAVGDKSYEDTHHYAGIVEGETITFTLTTVGGGESHVPVRFTVQR